MSRTRKPNALVSPPERMRTAAAVRKALATSLDGDPKARAALIKRLAKTCERLPIAQIHSLCLAAELALME